MIIIKFQEDVFSVNEFNEPKVYKNAEGAMMLLTRLLLLEKGQIESHPDMGVGLISNFRYADEGDIYRLRSSFREQIDKYIPSFTGCDITVEYKDMTFFISVTMDGQVFGFKFNVKTNDLQTRFSALSDL